MAKSYAEMADEILNGALSDPVKNPYDPTTGHQASMPAMDANDTLLEMNDTQRMSFISGSEGIEAAEPEEEVIVESTEQPTGFQISQEELQVLEESKKIITKIQEATTVGSIGVSYASTGQGGNPKGVKLPGDVNVASAPKKRVKKKTKLKKDSDFLSYIRA